MTSPLESATATVTTTSAPPDPSATKPTGSMTNPTNTATTRVSTTTTGATPATTAATAASTPRATQTTTTTSAPSAPSIPSKPGDLSATAETETAGTVKVNGTANDVVVKGDELPTDARTAPEALDTWINDARQPGGDWTAFTSTEPTSDGWRWAAINQKTGTVVYIR